MLVFENGGWQTNSEYPDSNYLEGTEEVQPKWVVNDNSEVAAKVMSTPYWNPVEDENGNLIDIEANEPTDEEKISELKLQLSQIDGQTIRPLRAIVDGTETEEDREILHDLEQKAAELRQLLAKIEGLSIQEGGIGNNEQTVFSDAKSVG